MHVAGVGENDGASVGDTDGLPLGASVGDVDGAPVGLTLGLPDGTNDGVAVGLAEGAILHRLSATAVIAPRGTVAPVAVHVLSASLLSGVVALDARASTVSLLWPSATVQELAEMS